MWYGKWKCICAHVLIYLSSLCLLIGAFNPFIVKVIIYMYDPMILLGFPGGSDGKGSTCNVGDPGSIPGLGRSPGGEHGNPLKYSLENPHGQRSLAGYSPWGHKESDTTEQLSTAQHMILLPFSFFQLIFLLKDSCFKELCCFLSNLNRNQP